MNITKEEVRTLDRSLTEIMERSQRSLVSLRHRDMDSLALDVEELAASITAFVRAVGADRA